MTNLNVLLKSLLPRARADGPVDVVLNHMEIEQIVSALDLVENIGECIGAGSFNHKKGDKKK